MTTALFIGRFQPFHLGHLSVVEQILKENDHLILGIGSSQYSETFENPYTLNERKKLIRAALDEAHIPREKYDIIAIPDIHEASQWVKHVRHLTPPFDVLYTGSPLVKKLFAKDKQTPIKAVTFRHDISATRIREAIVNEEKWENMVPPAVALLLKKYNA